MSCTFCGGSIEAGTGKMYVRRDGTVLNFCSAKCQRNQIDLGRVNRHVGWTKAYAEHKGDRAQAQKASKKAAKPKAAKAAVPAAPTAGAPAKAKGPAK